VSANHRRTVYADELAPPGPDHYEDRSEPMTPVRPVLPARTRAAVVRAVPCPVIGCEAKAGQECMARSKEPPYHKRPVSPHALRVRDWWALL